MKKIIIVLAILLFAGCGMVYHADTKFFPHKYAGFNWRDGKFLAEERRIFKNMAGEILFTEPTGENGWMTPEEYCDQWGMDICRPEVISGVTYVHLATGCSRLKCVERSSR